MPDPQIPYDPKSERQDAFGELARKGFQTAPEDLSERLSSLHNRLGLIPETPVPSKGQVRSLTPRRWLAIAAGIAALVVASLVLTNYEDSSAPTAMVEKDEQVDDKILQEASLPLEPIADQSASIESQQPTTRPELAVPDVSVNGRVAE